MLTRHEQKDYDKLELVAKTVQSEIKFLNFIYGFIIGTVLTLTCELIFYGFYLM